MKKELPYKFVIRDDGPFLVIIDGYEIKSRDFVISNGQIIIPDDDIFLNISTNHRILNCVSKAIEIHILCLLDDKSKIVALQRS